MKWRGEESHEKSIGQIVKTFIEAIGKIIGVLVTGVRRLGIWLANQRRRLLRGRLPDYVVFELTESISERAPIEPLFYQFIPGRRPAMSLESLSEAFRKVAGDADICGIVLIVRGPSLSLTQAQSMAALFDRFRHWDETLNRGENCPDDSTPDAKTITVHLEQISMATYVMAAAADRIVVTPLTTWDVFGFRAAPTFLKDTFARFGIEFDVVKIAPWKTAGDTLSRSSMSDEQRAQLTWLLDSLYDEAVASISQGRGIDPGDVEALIDHAPITAHEAELCGLVDEIGYEDELPLLLGSPEAEDQDGGQGKSEKEPAKLGHYNETRFLLYRRLQPRYPKTIGVLNLQGAIVPGTSRHSPFPLPITGENTIGSATVQQQLRAAREDESLAAVVLHVDSPGGSALASDLIWRELNLLEQTKPLIVYMGGVAASGGYYIAAPGRKIVAQRSTLTGSIGVIVTKPVTQGLYDKLDANTDSVQRGDNADLYTTNAAWTSEQYETVEAGVRHFYSAFKQRVADGRSLEFDSLDEICNGRVWTGAQAQQHGLVDELGDFEVALALACEAADLPIDGTVPTTPITTPRHSLLAAPAEAVQTWLGLRPYAEFGELFSSLASGDLQKTLRSEHIWFLADDLPDLR